MELFWYTLLATIIGVLVGSLLTFLISLRVLKRQEFNKAAAKFRSAFAQTERMIDPKYNITNNYSKGEFVFNSVLKNIPEQEKAMVEFSHIIKRSQKKKFNNAWMKYAYPNWYDEIDDPQIDYKSEHVDEQPNIRKLLRERLNQLFEYSLYR